MGGHSAIVVDIDSGQAAEAANERPAAKAVGRWHAPQNASQQIIEYDEGRRLGASSSLVGFPSQSGTAFGTTDTALYQGLGKSTSSSACNGGERSHGITLHATKIRWRHGGCGDHPGFCMSQPAAKHEW
jgi:hypothetical protein